MKRFFGLLLVMAMVFSLSVPAYAADRVSVEEEMLCAINALNKNFRNVIFSIWFKKIKI